MADDPVRTRYLRDKYSGFTNSGLAANYEKTLWADYMAAGERMTASTTATSTTMEGSSFTAQVTGDPREDVMAYQATIDSILDTTGAADPGLGHILDRSCRMSRT